MAPLHAARIKDLGSGDFVKVEFAACGHETLIPLSALLVLDLKPRLRCRECDARGKALVSIRVGAA